MCRCQGHVDEVVQKKKDIHRNGIEVVVHHFKEKHMEATSGISLQEEKCPPLRRLQELDEEEEEERSECLLGSSCDTYLDGLDP